MRKQVGPKICIVFLLALVLIFAGCERKTPEVITDPEIKEESSVFSQTESDNTEVQSALPETSDTSKPEKPTDLTQETDAENMELIMKIDGTEVSVEWENNESVDAIRELAASGGLEINMSMYGGFEQVGSIGQSIPSSDEQTTTKAGDIVLYSGNQVVVFYGSNSWAYTRLGRITDKTEQELAEMLGKENVVLSFEIGAE
jgi:cytoskeletal protein RodZ